MAGKDASKQFWKYHGEAVLKKYKPKLQIGSLDSKPKAPAPAAKPAAEPKPVAVPNKAAAPAQTSEPPAESEALEPFGQQIPFGDPGWYQSVSFIVPYFAVMAAYDVEGMYN